MAYDPKAENLQHLHRIMTGLLDFRGRSRRSEFGVFIAAVMAVSIVALLISLTVFSDLDVPFRQYLQLALWLPAFPLFVRRLHDQDRTGWLALVLPILIGLKIYEQVLFEAQRLRSPALGFPFNIAELILVVAFWVLVFWPGTAGDNRYGPDPRTGEATAV